VVFEPADPEPEPGVLVCPHWFWEDWLWEDSLLPSDEAAVADVVLF
jgi:hypothetical protein